MLIDKFRGLIRSDFDWKKILMYSLPIVSFIIGLLVPSPLFDRLRKEAVDEEEQQLVEVAGLVFADGSRYDGSVIKGTKTRQGYGRLTTADSTVYEGNWRNDELPYGQRTTSSSVYRGRFDKELNNEGFGIIEYSEAFIDGKRKQGMAECDIVQTYIGNWHNNNKQELGRSVKVDGSMDFGRMECHHPQFGKDGCLWEERIGYVRPYTGVGRIEAYPMFDDGEEDDNVLRLIGLFLC